MDTGLGQKAYAIIEQGKIGMILSTRPTDRRQLIEEAAGVTKYRSRRRAAELKLEAAQQNLTRIDDIVFELDKQRVALKRQAARARRYQRLRDELRRWEKVLFARKYRQLAATIESARARLLEARDREAAAAANAERDRAAATLASESLAYESAHRGIEGLEADVEAARSEVFSAINSATALRHALEHAAAARERVAETLAKLDVEEDDVRVESDRVKADGAAAAAGLEHAQDQVEATRIARAARESELASARIEHEWRTRSVRALEHELAGREARLKSLEELEAARAAYGDAPRTVLAQVNGKVDQRGAIADYV